MTFGVLKDIQKVENRVGCTHNKVTSVLPQTKRILSGAKWTKQRKDILITKNLQ